MKRTISICILWVLTASGCASGPPQLPYPAFVQVDDLSDVFVASLPGVRAKQLAGDPMTRRSSKRIDLPADWSGTSGAAPGRSLELFVLQGELRIADLELGPGGYAFLPSGSLGFNLSAPAGARILYYVNDVDPDAVIRSPIILDTNLLDWVDTGTRGRFVKELRNDPGNGAMTWLLRVETGAASAWESSSAAREGYLVSGTYQHSECVAGTVHTAQYLPGGYFLRPAGIVNGGPLSKAMTESVWLLRRATSGATTAVSDCTAQPEVPPR